MLLVMGLLFRDVLRNHTNAGFTHAENSISGLPRKSRTVFLPHPPRRIRLDHAHNLRWRMNRSHTHQHVNMIGHSIHDQCDTAHLANNPAEIGEQTIAEFCLYQRPSPLSRKNQMQQNISRRMRHCLSPLRGLFSCASAYPRLTPWAATLPPLRGCNFGRVRLCAETNKERCDGCHKEEGRAVEIFGLRRVRTGSQHANPAAKATVNPSRKAAKECSPRRKPWVGRSARKQPRRGERNEPGKLPPPPMRSSHHSHYSIQFAHQLHKLSYTPGISLLRTLAILCYKQ